MHTSLALLWCVSIVALASVCFSRPNDGIINIAQTTLVHIKIIKAAKWQVSPPVSTPPIIMEGLSSIGHGLGLLDAQLQKTSSSQMLTQIQADVSSLLGRVLSLSKTMGCSVPTGSSGGPNAIEDAFPDTRQYQTLVRVQDYLEHLVLNQGTLQVC